MGRLADQIGIVTGTSRGIGRALAAALAAEGMTVIGCSRSGGCDVSREEDVLRLFDGLREPPGRLDLLVNNAGILTPRKPLVEVSAEEWDRSLAVNLRGVFLCTREALRRMLPRGSGLIVNISSGAGRRGAARWGPYAVAKWGVEGLTRSVAAEIEGSGVRIVSVNPQATRTGMRALAYPQEDPATVKAPEDLARYILELVTGERAAPSGASLDYQPS